MIGTHRKTKGKATEEDVYIGQRIKLKRNYLNISQQSLGESLGLTFQQIQKYETGTNRVSGGTLYQISSIFDVPFQYFVEGMEGYLFSQVSGSSHIGLSDNEQEEITGRPINKNDDDFITFESLADDKDLLKVIKKYKKIRHNKNHKKLLNEFLDTLYKVNGGVD